MGDVVDPAIRLERLINKQAPRFAAGFQLLVKQLKRSADLTTIADLLERGRLEEALALTLARTPALGNLSTDGFLAAAEDTARFLNREIASIVVDFDRTNPFAMSVARENQLRLVAQFSDTQRRATSTALIDGIRSGNNPLDQARAFRDSIGLTDRQVRAVANYKRMLREGDPTVFDRALRDKRFDRTIRRSIEQGRPLTNDQIVKMTDRYRDRYVQYRSRVIARTESMRSIHQGNRAMYDQAIESGDLDPNNLMQEWNTARDERVRNTHSTMHNQTTRYDEPFISGDGNQTQFPGGFGVAAEDIQCRCAVGTRITNIVAPAGFSISVT